MTWDGLTTSAALPLSNIHLNRSPLHLSVQDTWPVGGLEKASDQVAEASSSLDYFEAAYGIYRHAAGEKIQIERFILLGAHVLRLHFAGPALLDSIMPALSHLELKRAKKASFTICIWDSQSTQTQMPEPLFLLKQQTAIMENYLYSGNRIKACFSCGGSRTAYSLYDSERNLALFWVPDAHRVPSYQSAHPLLAIFYWWLKERGSQMVHAGAVGTKKGGVLLVGKGGSGKSTAALACCTDPRLFYAGDDYVAIHPAGGWTAHNLYSSIKLDWQNRINFPRFFSDVSNPEEFGREKAVIFFANHFAHKLIKRLPLRALFLVHISNANQSKLTKVSPATALRALSPSTLFQLPGTGASDLNFMADMVRKIPSYTFELGRDIRSVPDLCWQFLNS